MPDALFTGDESRTVTTLFEGTSVAPVAGVLETTVRFLAAAVWVVVPPWARDAS